jgi:hypothetical protein
MQLLNKIVNPFKFKQQVPVDSAVFLASKYSRRERCLTLYFENGSVYRYGSVEPSVYRKFMNAESKGKFFHKHIRSSYPFIKSD